MSANLIVDIRGTADYASSFHSLSGTDTVVGAIVDLLHADTNCQVFVAAVGGLSGVIPVFIQTSDATTSGSFTDPTSGLPTGAFPVGDAIVSGGIFYANSGLLASGNQSPSARVADAPALCSGGIQWASFQRPHRYARLIATSGTANGISAANIMGGFLSNKRTTGSGAGFTLAPGSGTVSV